MNAPVIGSEIIRKFDFDVDKWMGRERVEGKVSELAQALADSGYTLGEVDGYKGYYGYMMSRDVIKDGVEVGHLTWQRNDSYGIFLAH